MYVVLLNYNEGYERDTSELIGVFSTEENANNAINEDFKRWHFSCGMNIKDYDIEECVLNERLN